MLRHVLLLLPMVALFACTSSEPTAPPTPIDVQPTKSGGTDTNPPEGPCEDFGFSYGPNALPQAVVGEPYVVDFLDYADPQFHGSSYRADSLPDGFKLSPSTRDLGGTPTKVGRLTFRIYATRGDASSKCSQQPDQQELTLDVVATDADRDGGGPPDASVKNPK